MPGRTASARCRHHTHPLPGRPDGAVFPDARRRRAAGGSAYDRAASAFALAPGGHDWRQLLSGRDWLHISGITPAVSGPAAQEALRAVESAREAGVRVSFDCNFRSSLWTGREAEASRLLGGLCAHATLAFADERDIALMLGQQFAGEPDLRGRAAAQAAFEAFPVLQWLACTRRLQLDSQAQELVGVLFTRSQRVQSRTHVLASIVDRIGAGDAFAAGILHGLLTGMEPEAMVEFAAAASALKHWIPGDFNLVSVAEVQRLLQGQSGDVRR